MRGKKRLIKRGIVRVVFMLFVVIGSVLPGFGYSVDDFSSETSFPSSKASLYVLDLKADTVVASLNSGTPLVPASIMKAVTTASLLEKVGPKYKYSTRVYFTGSVNEGVLSGDIVVEASGDPSLNSVNEPCTADFVEEVAQAVCRIPELRLIEGAIRIEEGDFPGPSINPTWVAADLPHAYGTGSHGFNFEDNASGKRSLADPGAVFRTRLIKALNARGVEVAGRTDLRKSGKTPVGHHDSATIDEIMRSCMMRSDNQMAEGMLRLIGLEYGGEGSTARGASEMMRHWKHSGVNMDGVEIVDGSGLSRSNRVTARFMADILAHMAPDRYYASFFPLAGQEGTLRKFLVDTPLEGELALKTGSMSGIQCYAGYKLDEDYAPTHAVVFIINGLTDRSGARKAVEKLLLSLFCPSATDAETEII